MAYTTKSDIDASSRATIETSYPLFVIHTNHVTTLPSTPLHTLCAQIHTTALDKIALTPLAPILPLDAILTAIFDPAHRAFVLPPSSADPSSPTALPLSEDARACIFAQAIAGIVYFLRSVALSRSPKTEESIQAALRRFAEGEDRERILREVEAWHGWGDCFEKAQIGGMIMAVVGIEAAGEKVPAAGAAAADVVEVDEVADAPVLFNDGPHLTREFGVPDRFHIMALN